MLMGRFSVAVVLVGLGTGLASGASAQAAEVQVAPASVTLTVGGRSSVLATVYDAKGNVLPNAVITWNSSDLKTVRVEPDRSTPGVGNLVGVAPGLAQVEARVGSGHKGTVVVQVTAGGAAAAAPAPSRPSAAAPPPAAPAVVVGNATVVKLDPGNVLLLPSEAQQLVISFLRDDGSSATPSTLIWKSLQPTVASVNESGLVVAIQPGQGLIEASTPNGIVARAPIQVQQTDVAFTRTALSLSPGSVDTVHAYVPGQSNRQLAGPALQWSSSDTAVVRVSPLGIVTAVGPGKATVKGAGFLQERLLPVTVHRPVTILEVSPGVRDSVLVPVGGAVHFAARPMAADHTEVTEASVTFDLTDTTVASFDVASGNVTGKKIGATKLRIHAPGRGLDTAWTLSVIAGGIKVDAPRVGLDLGAKRKVAASFTDSRGNAIAPASGVTWTSVSPNVATVEPDGTIAGAGWGGTQVVVKTPWGKADTVNVFVEGEVLVTSTRSGSQNLYTFDRAQPGKMGQLTSDAAASVSAAYSPDGTRIAYISTRDGNPEIYAMNADGSGAQRLTTTPGREDTPSWTADGRQIVFGSDRSGKMQVWIMNADGTNSRQLTPETGTNSQPAVSPDGQTIAFTSTRDGNYDVYLMALDGSNQRNITQHPKPQQSPAWLNNGQLAFISEQSATDRVVMRKTLASGEMVAITAPQLITGFAVSKTGDLLALIVSTIDANGRSTQKLFLQPVGTGLGAPVEVPRTGAEQYQTPAFKR
jgi:hypothetical protein